MRTEHDTPHPAADARPLTAGSGLAGLVTAWGEQRRANRRERFDRKMIRAQAAAAGSYRSVWGRCGAAVRRIPGRILGAGVSIGWLMALIGSGVGQLAWWSSQFPLWLAGAFAVAFEAIMIGAGRKARERRMRRRPALSLRLVALSAAITGAALNWFHLSDPRTVISAFGSTIVGSLQLGAAFALFTAAGFLVHELAENAAVNDALRDHDYIHPLGARWLFILSAVRTKLLMIDQPQLSTEQAWQQVRRPRRPRRTARAAFAVGRASARTRPKQQQAAKDEADAEPVAAETSSAPAAEPARSSPTHDDSLEGDTVELAAVPASDADASPAADPDEQVTELAALLATGQDITGPRAAEMFGCSERTGRRLINRAKHLHDQHRPGRSWRSAELVPQR